jgi:hypothetical protein
MFSDGVKSVALPDNMNEVPFLTLLWNDETGAWDTVSNLSREDAIEALTGTAHMICSSDLVWDEGD